MRLTVMDSGQDFSVAELGSSKSFQQFASSDSYREVDAAKCLWVQAYSMKTISTNLARQKNSGFHRVRVNNQALPALPNPDCDLKAPHSGIARMAGSDNSGIAAL
jgi:hypothetical protein